EIGRVLYGSGRHGGILQFVLNARAINAFAPAFAHPIPSLLLQKSRRRALPSRKRSAHIGSMPKAQKPYRTARGVNQGMAERPQRLYEPTPALETDPELAKTLGFKIEPQEDFVPSQGSTASAEALQKLLDEGRPEFRNMTFVPHRPARPEKSEGGKKFKLVSPYDPKGDQPQAIEELVKGANAGERTQVLLGVTGSGKTYTMAQVIERTQRPALVLAPNKTLAAQLYGEFKSFFPENAVEYFVSYYDYYQPEAYVPRTDTYIEKDSAINEQIDRMRHAATRALLERDDVIIVASVSCIYGIGSVETYTAMTFALK